MWIMWYLKATWTFEAVLSDNEDKIINWYTWEYITITGEDTQKQRIISCVPKTTTVRDFMSHFENNVEPLPTYSGQNGNTLPWNNALIICLLVKLVSVWITPRIAFADFNQKSNVHFMTKSRSRCIRWWHITSRLMKMKLYIFSWNMLS